MSIEELEHESRLMRARMERLERENTKLQAKLADRRPAPLEDDQIDSICRATFANGPYIHPYDARKLSRAIEMYLHQSIKETL